MRACCDDHLRNLRARCRSADGRRLTWSEAIGCLAPDVQKDAHTAGRWGVLTEQVRSEHPFSVCCGHAVPTS